MAGDNMSESAYSFLAQKVKDVLNEAEQTELEKNHKCSDCREEFYKLIAEFSSDWIYWVNPDSTIGFVSTSCKYITGYEPDEMSSNPEFLKEIVYPADLDKYNKLCEAVSHGINFYTDEFRIVTKMGNVNWIYLVSQKVYDNSGNFMGRYVCARDITDVKSAFRDLDHHDNLVLRIYNEASVGYYQIYFDGTLKGANKIFLDFLGYDSIDDFNDINFEQSCVLDLKKRERFKKMLTGQGRVKDYESEWIKRDGSVICLLETGRSVNNSTYTRPYYEGVAHDISYRKNTHQTVFETTVEKRKIELLKGDLLATISHEIRTPLNVITNFTKILKNELGSISRGDLSDGFNIIECEVKRIDRTLNLIVEMSMLQSDTYDYNLTEINLIDDIFIPVYDEYYNQALEKGIKFIMNNETSEKTICGDKHGIMQIFIQLVDNAFKYTRKGKIEMILRKSGNDKIAAEVVDTGIGIKKEYIPHLFNIFSQEDNTRAGMFEGTGLGLALAYKYCKINNAEIDVESEKGVGTKFIVTFNR
jgi:PAS domain S-box-containing protein